MREPAVKKKGVGFKLVVHAAEVVVEKVRIG